MSGLPPVRAIRKDGDALQLDLGLPADLPCFRGHFPELPVLPGVAQLDWAIRFARLHLGVSGRFERVRLLKFRRMVQPGHALTLSLASEQPGRISFRFTTDGRECSSGRIEFVDG